MRHPCRRSRSATQAPIIARGAGAPVGLQHIAIDRDLPLAETRQIDDRAQRPADQALDLVRCGRKPCRWRSRASSGSGSRAAASHVRPSPNRVPGRATAAAACPRARPRTAHACRRSGRDGAFRITRQPALEAHGAHFVSGAFNGRMGEPPFQLSIRSAADASPGNWPGRRPAGAARVDHRRPQL